jgi:signal transduction histidine kinase
MTQVLTNLLSNAAKFSPAGSEVVIKIETAGDKVLVSVIDEGRGISDDFKHKLFRRFSQDISSAVPGHAGSGLGLAITKSIVEAHGGTIGLVESTGKGTTFRLELAAA